MPHNTCKYCGCDVLGNAEYCDNICKGMAEEENNTTWVLHEPGKEPVILTGNPLEAMSECMKRFIQ